MDNVFFSGKKRIASCSSKISNWVNLEEEAIFCKKDILQKKQTNFEFMFLEENSSKILFGKYEG